MKLIPRGSGEVIEIDRRIANRSPRLEGYFGDEEVMIDAQAQDVRDYIHFLKSGEIRDPDLINTIFPRMGHIRCPRDMDPGYCAAAFEDDWFQKYGTPMEGLIPTKTVMPPPEYALAQPYFYVGETALKWMGIIPSDQPGVLVAFLQPEPPEREEIVSPMLDASEDFVAVQVEKPTWDPERILEYTAPARGRRFEEDEFTEMETKVGNWDLLPKTEREYFRSFRSGFVPGGPLAGSPSVPRPEIRPQSRREMMIIPGESRMQSVVVDLTLYSNVQEMAHSMFPSYRQVVMNQAGDIWMTHKAWWMHTHKTIYLQLEDMEFIYSSNLLALKGDIAQYRIKFLDMSDGDILEPLEAITAMEYLMGDYYYKSFKDSAKNVVNWLRYGIPETRIDRRGKEYKVMIPVDRTDQQKMRSYARTIITESDRIISAMPSPFIETIYDRWLRMGREGVPAIHRMFRKPWILHAQLLMQYNFAFNSPVILFPMDYPLSYVRSIPWKTE